ncbi:uncharacterized protein LAESUDRAFT_750263 [Laetiporus sulphureus 93-53]|uniref:Uncharacterized protein n=1 Tax=Laetiporus sulphureus 93-53 TaxID=1314785 RepID=A0A165DXG0_9APHY|nr:uncharacterized protein LAESUDRAFT_750263 [Laetiporus sulphureus 93-53]KZT05823.1 hypothetical protein LAESUDRAFT_750263 [Laetiporus sulphureus 93-53]
MAYRGPMLAVHHYEDGLHNDPNMLDADILEFVGDDHIHDLHSFVARPSSRGSASSPPPPYTPMSWSSSPLPTPAFSAHHSFTIPAPLMAQQERPVPQSMLDDPAFSPDPRRNPHFVMTTTEEIRAAFAAPSKPPHVHVADATNAWKSQPLPFSQVPRMLQPGFSDSSHLSVQHPRAQSAPYVPFTPRVISRDVVPSVSRASTHTISASSVFPLHTVWQPPATYRTSSIYSDSIDGIEPFLVQRTPETSSPSSTSSSPRGSPLSVASKTALPPAAPVNDEYKISHLPPPPAVSVVPPPRSSSLAHAYPSRSAQAPLPNPVAIASEPIPTRPEPPLHNESSPELHSRAIPASQRLARSATVPAPPAPPVNASSQAPSRSQSHTTPREQQRGRSRDVQPVQNVPRNRSRRPSVSAPRDLDRIDELDETDPRGLAWHHESPYEAIARSVGRQKDGSGMIGVGTANENGTQRKHDRSRERTLPIPQPSANHFSVEPGQIFPTGALFQAAQAPYVPPQATSSYPPLSTPYNEISSQTATSRLNPQNESVYASVAPSPPPVSQGVSAHGAHHLGKTQSRPVPTTEEQPPTSTSQISTRRSPRRVPVPVDTVSLEPNAETPSQPLMQQRPSQRPHVRFESPTRPQVKPPLNQGSVDEGYNAGAGAQQPSADTSSVPFPVQQPSRVPVHTAQPPVGQPQVHSNYPGSNESSSTSTNADLISQAAGFQRPDIQLPPRRPPPSWQMQSSLPPSHLPKQLVMPAPLQPLEEQRKAGLAQQQQDQFVIAPYMGRTARSDEGHGGRTDVHVHSGKHVLHHSVSHTGYYDPASTRARKVVQGRAEAIPMTGPNVLHKRTANNVPAPEPPASTATTAMFAARVVDTRDGGGKAKAEKVASALWPRDRCKDENDHDRGEKKHGRKLSKLGRKLTK